ncbi:uncharacterized protein LOC131957636 [Physella acuta]|uniref:uncharacterized protein LOC131957636 n=1 Tax=Physella acuta TaxID=109671 RepID=UPI0027DB6164|nr:uncharacterized protein LOC131957636 [Physella acuta]
MVVKVDQLSKKQKQNFKNMRKQLKDYDDNQKKSNLEIEYLQEKESFLSKTLENLSLDIKENESNLNKLNKQMQLQTDKTSVLIQEIKSQTDSMSDLQEEQKKRAMQTGNQIKTITSAHGVICQLLQQRLVAIDKLFQLFNQNLTARDENMMRLDVMEHKLLEISLNNQLQFQPHVKPPPIGFVALHGTIHLGDIGIDKQTHFQLVESNEGNHFDPKTGVFTSPVDGLYKASLTIKQTESFPASVCVVHQSGGRQSQLGWVNTKNESGDASRIFELRMKPGDLLFIESYSWEAIDCTHFSCFLVDF